MMNISSALEIIRNAPPQVLQNHKHEAIEAFREIEARLRELDSPESDSSIRASTAVANGPGTRESLSEVASIQPPLSVERHSVTPQARTNSPSHTTNLFTALNKISSLVWKFTKLRPSMVLGIKRPRVCDRRLADVRRIDGEPQAEPKYKILRVLAQRSLVLQGEKSGYLDVENYCKIASSKKRGKVNRGRQGNIALYIREELAIGKEDKDFAIRAVSAGIKQLATERLLKKRLEEAGQHGSASGISAFTALVVRPFRCLKYEEIPEFLDSLLESDSMDLSTLTDNPELEHALPVPISEVIRVTSAWFDELQTYYNRFLENREDFDKHQSNERERGRRMRHTSSVCDRTTSSTETPIISDRLSAIEFYSSDPGENRNIHHRPTSPQEITESNHVLEHLGSNVSGSPYSTGPTNPLFVSHGPDDQNHTRPTPNLVQPRESPGSSLSSRECLSHIGNAMSDIVSSDFPPHITSQPHGTSIQSYAGTNETQIPFDPWQNVHATSQLHDPPLAPYAGTNETQIPFDPWQNVHATSQLHDPPLAPYAGTNETQIPFDPWQNVHATSQLHDPPLAPFAGTNETQIPFESPQHLPSQRAVYRHPTRSTPASREYMRTQISSQLQLPLLAT